MYNKFSVLLNGVRFKHIINRNLMECKNMLLNYKHLILIYSSWNLGD